MNRWDVWIADVPFEDIPAILKARPVLIMDNAVIVLGVFKMTSHSQRDALDYEIVEYKAAGLPLATVVRLSKYLILDAVHFRHPIGRLASIDIVAIQKLLSNL